MIQDEGRKLAEKYPEFVSFTDEPEPNAAPDPTAVEAVMEQALVEVPSDAYAQPDPETVQMHKLTLAQRMARAGRALAAHKRWAA